MDPRLAPYRTEIGRLCARHRVRRLDLFGSADGPAFDPKAESLPLAFFEPMVRNVMSGPKRSIYQRAME